MILNKLISPNKYLLILVCVCALAYFGYLTFTYCQYEKNIFGIDLRNRIIGARLLHQQKDAYFTKSTQNTPENLLDPLDINNKATNRNTVTPFYLYSIQPLIAFPYGKTKSFWFYFQFFCLLSTWLIFTLHGKSHEQKLQLTIATFLLIGASGPWATHVFVGQNYIVYPLLFTLIYFVDRANWKLVAGVLLGLTILLRPPSIVLLIPFILKKEFTAIKYSVVGLILGLVLMLPYSHQWANYFKAMKYHGVAQLSKINATRPIENREIENTIIQSSSIDFNENLSQNHNLSIQRIAYHFLGIEIKSKTLLTLYCITLIPIFVLTIKNKSLQSIEDYYLIGFLALILFDYFLPAPRYSYNYVQWLFFLNLFALTKGIKKLPLYLYIGLFIGFIAMLPLGNILVFRYSVGELIIWGTFFHYLIFTKPVKALI